MPIVVVDVMRGGPSTGIPAKSEQSDVSIALWGLHGDAPRIVVAPNSVADCLTTTQWAVHLAEHLQAPAIVLSDQFLGQARAVADRPADVAFIGERLTASAGTEGYRRYAITDSGISPMAIPGTPGLAYTADGLEHNERGIPSSGAARPPRPARQAGAQARGARLRRAVGGRRRPTASSRSSPSARAPERSARRWRAPERKASTPGSSRCGCSRRRGPSSLAAALDGVERVLVVEQNHGGQFFRYLRAEFDLPREVASCRHPGPLPIRPDEVYRQVLEWSRR